MAVSGEDVERVKIVLKHLHELLKQEWLEKQLMRNLIIDSEWMSEGELDSGIALAKTLPENIREADENFAGSEQSLAEIGLDDWLELLEKRFPRNG